MNTMNRASSIACLTALALLLSACAVQETERVAGGEVDHDHSGEGHLIGSVTFPTSCTPRAEPIFERGVAMLHSFWFGAAEETFREAAQADPECAMAHWGTAMTMWGNPITRAAPSSERAEAGLAAVRRARELARSATERERLYIEAAAALFEAPPETGALERMRAHEEAMRRVKEAYPEDEEAAIFYGRIVVANQPPDDLTWSRGLYAAQIMEPIFRARPDHPGVAHYLIHAYDAPPVAEKGLEAALIYADIAPDAPHALHMPTHIFTRLGYWEESIELNARSAAAEPVPDAAVHPMDYMVYAYLQLGRDREAGEVVARARDIPDRFYGGIIGYNFAAMQARYALERDRWAEAAALTPPAGVPPYVQAVTHFARAVGAARSGSPAAARDDVAALASLRDALRQAGDGYWTTVVEAQRLAAAAWVARSERDDAEALRLARAAADLEDTFEKHAVTPGPLLPARELLGDLLVELGRPADALREYTATLEKDRLRARALHGAARAADAAGEEEAAARYWRELYELLANADPERPDFQAARQRVASG